MRMSDPPLLQDRPGEAVRHLVSLRSANRLQMKEDITRPHHLQMNLMCVPHDAQRVLEPSATRLDQVKKRQVMTSLVLPR